MKRIWPTLILLASIVVFTSACLDDDLDWAQPDLRIQLDWWAQPGYYIHPDLLTKMQTDFDEVATETTTQVQSPKSFSELSIVFLPCTLQF
ncbi:hypothetical protein IH824_05960, partial [candidate division KSB1 bacterium]|nr:hypothetical protein [candidate division KSB1 bacterium]